MFKGLFARLLISQNIYACPNCGHHFSPDLNYVFMPRILRIFEWNKVILTCPECKIRDTCRRVKI